MQDSLNNTLNIDAYNLILKKLLSGELSTGQNVSEDAIANELGTSRTPVREAILWLQKEGYLEIYPRKGTFVSKFSLKEILDIYNLRLLLEPQVISSSFRNPTQAVNEKLTEYKNYNLQYIEDENIVSNGDAFFSQDLEFHLFLFDLINNAYIKRICRDALYKCIISKLVFLDQLNIKRSRIATQHVVFIDAALNGKTDEIFEIYKTHIISERDSIMHINIQ
ncbi:GntR family transcriptional regulator [Sinanaerobacter chloroacetimidivorans]|uniref:GntR family transcriptional regulator n=1 Tax=Sinanaerobacter chloroacetimidivorans TaxID=2818044 RepID=A0A8J7W0C1_9FIRM|nr:GntR family transcriptional regulator [Sinanaerobacter chloroacetimidivorans]MBR0598024.1 GntR family transcriptional regulator [Sinanaerobacter chloroacetimidivorans]